jgi:hypothetical protein
MEEARTITIRSPEYIELEHKSPFYHWKEQPKGNKKPLWKFLNAGDWKDEPCFLIGGGPSLLGFDFERLRGKGKIIAVNKAFFYVPFADMVLAMDQDFFKHLTHANYGLKYTTAFQVFPGWKVFVDSNNTKMDGVKFVFRWNLPELTFDMKKGVYCGNNSGVAALCMACLLGCSPIYLLGYDMSHKGKKSHFHSGYLTSQSPGTLGNFIKHFTMLHKQIQKKGIKVINLNQHSRLRCFEFGNINDIL